jgi:hypothetical protein
MYGNDFFDTFQLHNHQIIHDEICTIAKLDTYAFINNRKLDLDLYVETSLTQLVRETRGIRLLQKTRAKCTRMAAPMMPSVTLLIPLSSVVLCALCGRELNECSR